MDKTQATEVYAVHGADPEVLAYAMAKYSRSALTLRESLREISAQRAEQFLNTFYFQYGHRSIADLAHLAFAVERLSLLAAIVLVDEPRWDGQERSTRYQDFEKSGWYTPAFAREEDLAAYTSVIERLFGAYRAVGDGVFRSLTEQVARPEAMKQDAYERALRARTFDVARYLLPLAANTSLGQMVNARTLEGQVSRLLSHPLPEIRALGGALRAAAGGEAWVPDGSRGVRVAPTLVKYAEASRYAVETRALMASAAESLLGSTTIAGASLVDLVDEDDPLEVELAASLLYPACHHPYRQVRDAVTALPHARRDEIIALGLRERGSHDELPREFASGQRLKFDILMDVGGFRDMHRHRRCVQLIQPFTAAHGYDVPEGLAGGEVAYRAAMDGAHAASARGGGEAAPYLLPLGTRVRSLFKMDFAQALYIAELRSAPQGHLSYRRVAWEMYRAVEARHPALARHFRVTDVRTPVDPLKR